LETDLAEPTEDAEPSPEKEKEKETDLSWYAPAYEVGRKLMQEVKKQKNKH
jgi:hypothetical protein